SSVAASDPASCKSSSIGAKVLIAQASTAWQPDLWRLHGSSFLPNANQVPIRPQQQAAVVDNRGGVGAAVVVFEFVVSELLEGPAGGEDECAAGAGDAVDLAVGQ